jgi:hypothetical protein
MNDRAVARADVVFLVSHVGDIHLKSQSSAGFKAPTIPGAQVGNGVPVPSSVNVSNCGLCELWPRTPKPAPTARIRPDAISYAPRREKDALEYCQAVDPPVMVRLCAGLLLHRCMRNLPPR